MGTPENGSYVPRAELAAHIKGIDQHFDNLEADVTEIRYGILGIVEELKKQRDLREDNKRWDRRSWGPPIVAVFVAAAVSGLFSLLH